MLFRFEITPGLWSSYHYTISSLISSTEAALGYARGGSGSGTPGGAKTSGPSNPLSKVMKDSITLYIVADDKRKLDEAVKKIEEYIADEFHSEVLFGHFTVILIFPFCN